MGNITDDIRQHFDTFAELPFTEADSLALSQLAYARMPDNVPRYHENAETADGMIATVPIHDLLRAECYDDMFGKVWSPSMNVDLLRAMSESPRWRNLRVGAYVDEFDAETTKQFSACVFELGNGTLYVAFRGTDSSIVGWKEDFMMAFRRPVASQEAAARYLTELAGHWAGPIMVGGHSKGGNLAVYAAANVPGEIQGRITAVYSHDGPGFDEAFFDEDGYARIAPKSINRYRDRRSSACCLRPASMWKTAIRWSAATVPASCSILPCTGRSIMADSYRPMGSPTVRSIWRARSTDGWRNTMMSIAAGSSKTCSPSSRPAGTSRSANSRRT